MAEIRNKNDEDSEKSPQNLKLYEEKKSIKMF